MIIANIPGCQPECRACHYRHLGYPDQLERKSRWAQSQLAAWGDRLLPLIAAPQEERVGYRKKAWLQCQVDLNGEVRFGKFRAVNRGGEWIQEFVDWTDCPLHDSTIHGTLQSIRQVIRLPEMAMIRQELKGIWFGTPHVVLVGNQPVWQELSRGLQAFEWKEILRGDYGFAWSHWNPQIGRKVFSHHGFTALGAASTALDDVNTAIKAAPPIKAFRQVAGTLLKEARRRAADFLMREPVPNLVLDLYSGAGDFSQLLPASVGWIGIEGEKAAAQFAESNSAMRPPDRQIHRSFVGHVEDRLSDPELRALLSGLSRSSGLALYVNPPRSGLSARAIEQIRILTESYTPTRMAILSCSASSLARNLQDLADFGWRCDELQPYDFFPQTEHFEVLACLSRSG